MSFSDMHMNSRLSLAKASMTLTRWYDMARNVVVSDNKACAVSAHMDCCKNKFQLVFLIGLSTRSPAMMLPCSVVNGIDRLFSVSARCGTVVICSHMDLS